MSINPDLIYQLYTGDFVTQIFRIALQLDVFTTLASGAASADEVAQSCQSNSTNMRALLDTLWGCGLLTKQGMEYALTPTAATFLVRQQKTYAGDWVLALTDPQFWGGFLQAIRDGKPMHFAGVFEQDAWLESYSTWRPENSVELWRAAGLEPGKHPDLRVLDLACGCAIKSFVLAAADPTVCVTCVDREAVLEVARDLADRWRILPQVSFRAQDLLIDTWDAGEYDVVLLGQITYFLTPAQNRAIFERVLNILSPGGQLVIDATMLTESSDTSTYGVNLLSRVMSGGGAHSVEDYRGWLEKAGFISITQLGDRWLSAST